VQNAATAIPSLRGHEVQVAIGLVIFLTAMNLRGVRESGKAFAVPVYAFILGIVGMGVVGVVQAVTGSLGHAESAQYELIPDPDHEAMVGIATAFLLLRAFSSGCAALTGVEAISNGVPAFQKPKSRNAASTLLMMGLLSITMLGTIIGLGRETDIKIAERPAEQLALNGQAVGEAYIEQHPQDTVLGQLAHAVFGSFTPGIIYVSITTGLILILAAAAAALIVAYQATVTSLIQLYIVGVFVSFTLSQSGMIRHWNRHLQVEVDPKVRARMKRSRVINAVGAAMSGTVLLVVLITKFQAGARYAILAMAVLFVLMLGIRRHYRQVAEELKLDEDETPMLPSRVHAIVLISKLHKPAMRAVAYARATRPTFLEAITVDVDPEDTETLRNEWARREIPVPLKVLSSPYREITRPIIEYVHSLRTGNPRDVVIVYIPEYVLGRWYEQVLHNQSALRLKARLLFTPGVMVASVPWQLRSSEGAEDDDFDGPVVGSVRRGPR
jgi:hypothetical protein